MDTILLSSSENHHLYQCISDSIIFLKIQKQASSRNDECRWIETIKEVLLKKFKDPRLKYLLMKTYPKKLIDGSQHSKHSKHSIDIVGIMMEIRDYFYTRYFMGMVRPPQLPSGVRWIFYPYLLLEVSDVFASNTRDTEVDGHDVVPISSYGYDLAVDIEIDRVIALQETVYLYPFSKNSTRACIRFVQRNLIFEDTNAKEYVTSCLYSL